MICCDGDTYNCTPGGGGGGGPVGSWGAKLLWEHSPGFFSCERFQGETLLGTYCTCLGPKAHLCHLETRSVIRNFSGESIYHLRNQGDAYCYVACEKGSLYKLNTPLGVPVLLEARSYPMGYYDALDANGDRYSIEKKSIGAPNQIKLRKNGVSWVTGNFGCKEETYGLGSVWLGTYNLNNAHGCALCRVDLNNKTLHFYKKYQGNMSSPAFYGGQAWATMQIRGGGAGVVNSSGDYYPISSNSGWTCKVVNGSLLVTATDGGWRGYGPSKLFEYDGATNQFVQVLQFPDAEPWDICPGVTADKFIFVTRNEHEWCGMGRVYELTRK